MTPPPIWHCDAALSSMCFVVALFAHRSSRRLYAWCMCFNLLLMRFAPATTQWQRRRQQTMQRRIESTHKPTGVYKPRSSTRSQVAGKMRLIRPWHTHTFTQNKCNLSLAARTIDVTSMCVCARNSICQLDDVLRSSLQPAAAAVFV